MKEIGKVRTHREIGHTPFKIGSLFLHGSRLAGSPQLASHTPCVIAFSLICHRCWWMYTATESMQRRKMRQYRRELHVFVLWRLHVDPRDGVSIDRWFAICSKGSSANLGWSRHTDFRSLNHARYFVWSLLLLSEYQMSTIDVFIDTGGIKTHNLPIENPHFSVSTTKYI